MGHQPNPFRNRTNVCASKYALARTLFMLFSGIAIAKLLLFCICTLFIALFIFLIMSCHRPTNANGDIQGIGSVRRFLFFIPQGITRLSLYALGYYYIKEYFPQNTPCFNYPSFIERPNASRVCVSTHYSIIDALYVMSKSVVLPVSRVTVLDLPLIGNVIRAFNPVLVGITSEQKASLPDAKTQIIKRAQSDIPQPVYIYAEGSTKGSDYHFAFQKGAFQPLLEVQPIALHYSFTYNDPSWNANYSFILILIHLCCQFYNTLEVTYLDPMAPIKADPETGITDETVEEFAERVSEAIRLVYNKQKCALTNQDNDFYKFFGQNISKQDYIMDHIYYGINNKGIVDFKKMTGLNTRQLKSLVDLFMSLDTTLSGKITSSDLKKAFPNNDRLCAKIVGVKDSITFADMIKFFEFVNKLKDSPYDVAEMFEILNEVISNTNTSDENLKIINKKIIDLFFPVKNVVKL